MKLSEVKERLNQIEELLFELPNGDLVPNHFHVTEVGLVDKHFIDCGGTVRKEQKANFQLWEADDYDHRLHPEKLSKIIELSEKVLEIPDLEVEVEYQGATIGKYGLDFHNGRFHLSAMQTDCLAKDNCGIPEQKPKKQLAEIGKEESSCTPGGGCC
ncbi:MAG: DUF6428 family protein [Vicingaceae bacterium]